MGTAIKHPVPDHVKPSFVIYDLCHSESQDWALECPDVKNYTIMTANPVWHRMLYSCTHSATVGVRFRLQSKRILQSGLDSGCRPQSPTQKLREWNGKNNWAAWLWWCRKCEIAEWGGIHDKKEKTERENRTLRNTTKRNMLRENWPITFDTERMGVRDHDWYVRQSLLAWCADYCGLLKDSTCSLTYT